MQNITTRSQRLQPRAIDTFWQRFGGNRAYSSTEHRMQAKQFSLRETCIISTKTPSLKLKSFTVAKLRVAQDGCNYRVLNTSACFAGIACYQAW